VASRAYTAPGDAHPPAPPSYPPASQPVYAEPPRRQKPLTAIALVLAALLLAGGGTTAALIITGKKKEPTVTAQQVAAPARTVTAPAPPTSKAVPPPQPTTDTPSQPSPSDTSTADAIAAEQALNDHWDAIGRGDFDKAFDYIDPSLGTDRSAWIEHHEQDGIQDITLETQTGRADGDNATVRVTKLVTIQSCGRQDWPATTYDMVRHNGNWYVHSPNFPYKPNCG
jgi:hypothetical protein